MAQSILNNCTGTFWREAKKLHSKKVLYPNKVDEEIDVQNIANVFGGKFDKLYNSVSYNVDNMNILKKDIISAVSNKCERSNCIHSNHSITFNNYHIIHASDKLTCYLALLFTAMLRHGTSSDDMLLGTMVPLAKGKWANLSSSDNFRAITLSSIFDKLLDFIKEENNLCNSDLHFSFKTGSTTSLCTSMVKETGSYYVQNGTNVYGLLLDASKAFDRVNHCKLFRLLLDRGSYLICTLIKNCVIDGKMNFLKHFLKHLQPQMVLSKAE